MIIAGLLFNLPRKAPKKQRIEPPVQGIRL